MWKRADNERKLLTDSSDSRAAVLLAAKAANAKKATDIVVQEVGALIGVTDYFLTLTAKNERQAQAVIDAIEEALRATGLKLLHRELTPGGTWSLLDYGSFIVHVFQPEARDHYQLEMLWEAAPTVDLYAEEGFEDLEYSERLRRFFKPSAD